MIWRRLAALVLACLLGLALGAARAESRDIFVAPWGSDLDEGTFARPFRTLARARLEVRAAKAAGAAPIAVNIRGGAYYFDASLEFTADDSGTAAAPITWRAYDGEEVLITGGIRLAGDMARPVADRAILSRVTDAAARARLMQLDLSGYLPQWPGPVVEGSAYEPSNGAPQIYIDRAPLTPARWPNDVENAAYLWADSAAALDDAQYAPVRLTSAALAQRAANWAPEAWRAMYLYAFMAYDYAEGIYALQSFDRTTGQMVTTGGHWGPPQDQPRFFAFNLPEEIDVPGECFIDYQRRIAYFYPPGDMAGAQIHLSLLQQPLVLLNGAHHLVFRGLTLGYTRGNPLLAYGVDGIEVVGCTVAHCSQPAVVLDGATNSAVRDCHIYDVADGGIYLWDGGLRPSLTPSGNTIEGNHIHHVSQLKKTWQVPLMVSSVGAVVRHNRIHDTNHIAIDISDSNDALVEYNEIYRTCLETSDTGAIYYGRDPTVMGVTIRYNYFHDIGNDYGGVGQQAIFCDDGASMAHIYGNLFVRAASQDEGWGAAVKANGAQYGVVEHNVFVDAPYAALFGQWPRDYDRRPVREDRWLLYMYDRDQWDRITSVDFFGETWRAHYRGSQWAPVWDALSPQGHAQYGLAEGAQLDQWAYRNAPARTNAFRGNVCVGVAGYVSGENGWAQGNLALGADIFVDGPAGDYRLTEGALAAIRQAIPGFEPIPLDRMGPGERDIEREGVT